MNFVLELIPGFYSHISNFTISYILYTGIGLMWLILDQDLKQITILGALLIFCNLIFELFLPILNTRDIVDPIFGVVGTALGYLILLYIKKYGLKKNR